MKRTGIKLALGIAVTLLSHKAFAFSETWLDWECRPSVWTSGPSVQNGVFDGVLEAECDFVGVAGGTLKDLEAGLVQEAIDKAEKIYQGPVASTFDGLPATYFDIQKPESLQGMSATVRADLYLATDGQTRFVNSTRSKSIQASGMAQNLKAINFGFVLTPSATPGEYRVKLSTSMRIEKPGLVPVGIFKKKVTEGAEESFLDKQKQMIEKFAKFL